jgi:ATP-dependent exoDNAse (exonuclease V) beta subunit
VQDAEPMTVPQTSFVVEEEDVDGPEGTADVDKATNLGSAFHQLAQTMVEAGGDHSPARLDALSRYWHLSARQHKRLVEAIGRWEQSDIRQEALAWGTVRPEVPFFIKVDSQYGTHVEGAIDLLCTEPDSRKALVLDYKTGDVGLTLEQIRARHEMQANFYAHVMMAQGYERVACAFVCVECDRGDGQPIVVRYEFDEDRLPRI